MSQKEILQKLASGQITTEEANKQLTLLQSKTEVHYKVSPKGGISFYGLRRFPITVYKDELDKILEACSSPEFKDFLKASASLLKEGPRHES